MTPATSITAVGTSGWIKFGAHEVFAARTTVATATKDAYIIYKVCSFRHKTRNLDTNFTNCTK